MVTADKISIVDRRMVELEIIRKRHKGLINPKDVVAFARNQSTALHSAFEWNNGKAAEEWRLQQARQLIRCCITIVPNSTKPIRAYVSLLPDRGGEGYRTLVDVSKSKKLRGLLLEQARKDADLFRRKYAQLTELMPIFEAMEQAFSEE